MTDTTEPTILELRPARVSSRGRGHAPMYLARVNYPGLLTGDRATATLIENPAGALPYHDEAGLEAAEALLRSIDYTPRRVTLAAALKGSACYVCGDQPHAGDARTHVYHSSAAMDAEVAEHDRRVIAAGGPRYSTGARNAEAAYVEETRGR